MSAADRVASVRQALEATFGLALEGLSDVQIETALDAAGPPAGEGDPRWLERVVDRLPIDESWLFRDDDLWAWLRDEAAPRLLERAISLGRPVRALSLACSTGQEAFSLAILFQGLLERAGIPPSAARAYVSIVGVDASPARVEWARTGVVNGWSVQRCRPDWLRGRVVPEEAPTARHRVDDSVRAMCRFEVGNLVALAAAGNVALGGYDLVLCRNVLIYFRAATAERLAAELARSIDPGALLVVCAAEAHLLAGCGLEPAGPLGVGAKGAPAPAPRGGRPRGRAPSRPVPPQRRDPRPGPAGDPGAGLVSRMIYGRRLIGVDAPRGREILRDLLSTASRLPSDSEVPSADGLTVGQLTAAVRLLLARENG